MLHWESVYAAVGKRIRYYREECKFTQAELASRLSLERTSITNIEKGRQKILLHTLIDLAIALDVTPIELLGDFAQKTNQANSSSEIIATQAPQRAEALKQILAVGSSKAGRKVRNK